MNKILAKHQFLTAFFISFLYLAFRFPALLTEHVVWAEMATHFLKVYDNSLPEVLSRQPAYLQLVTTLLPYLIKQIGVPIAYAPLALNIFACVAMCMCTASIFCFNKIFKSKFLQILAFLCLLFYQDFEIKTYIGFNYYLGIPIILFLLDCNNILEYKKRHLTFLSTIFTLAILSRPNLIPLITGFGVFGLFFLINKESKKFKRLFLFCIPLGLAIVIQIIYFKLHPDPLAFLTKIANVNDSLFSFKGLISIIYQFSFFIKSAIGVTKIHPNTFYNTFFVSIFFIIISSFCLRKSDVIGMIDENTPCNPLSFYGIAKNTLRQIVEVMCAEHHTILQWIRVPYITGHDDASKSIFGKIVKMEKEGIKTFPFVSGENKFDFIDISELAKQISETALQTEITGIVNACSGIAVSLKDKIEEFLKVNNFKIKPEYGKYQSRKYDSKIIYGCNKKIQQILLGKIN